MALSYHLLSQEFPRLCEQVGDCSRWVDGGIGGITFVGGLVVRGKEDRVAGDAELEPWVDCGEKVKVGFPTERFKYSKARCTLHVPFAYPSQLSERR